MVSSPTNADQHHTSPITNSKASDDKTRKVVSGYLHDMESKLKLKTQIPEAITFICLGFFWEEVGKFQIQNGLMIFIGSDSSCTNTTRNSHQILPIPRFNECKKKSKITSLMTSKKRKKLKRRKKSQPKLGLY